MAVEGWKETTLGQFVTLQRGHDLPEGQRKPGSVPILGSFGITGFHSEAKTTAPGVTVGRSGASFGVVNYSPVDFWPLNTALYVIDFHGNHPRFAYYFLQQFDFKRYNSGSAQPSLNRNFIHPIQVSVPPLPEQRAISHILGTLDDRIGLNGRMNETLESFARALFESWFVDFDPVRAKAEGCSIGLPTRLTDLFPDSFEDSELGPIPRGWHVMTLGDVSQKPQYGFTASATTEAVGPRFLRISDINKLPWIEWASVPYCQISEEETAQYRVRPGDILIARMADPGHGVMVEEGNEAVFASYLIRFQLRDSAYDRFIQYWLRSNSYWALVKARHAGTTRASLNAQVLSAFQIVVPPPEIAGVFRQYVSALRAKVNANVVQSETLSAVRDALLPKLISGEIRISDAKRILGG
jgi:type I restriction enzyme S subunit